MARAQLPPPAEGERVTCVRDLVAIGPHLSAKQIAEVIQDLYRRASISTPNAVDVERHRHERELVRPTR